MTLKFLNSSKEIKMGKKITIFNKSSPLFLEITYMLLQNKYIDKGVTNGLK